LFQPRNADPLAPAIAKGPLSLALLSTFNDPHNPENVEIRVQMPDKTAKSEKKSETQSGSGVVYAARFVLAARSPVFRAMFHGKHELQEKKGKVLHIEDFPLPIVFTFMHALYTDDVDRPSREIKTAKAEDKEAEGSFVSKGSAVSESEESDISILIGVCAMAQKYDVPSVLGATINALRYLVNGLPANTRTANAALLLREGQSQRIADLCELSLQLLTTTSGAGSEQIFKAAAEALVA